MQEKGTGTGVPRKMSTCLQKARTRKRRKRKSRFAKKESLHFWRSLRCYFVKKQEGEPRFKSSLLCSVAFPSSTLFCDKLFYNCTRDAKCFSINLHNIHIPQQLPPPNLSLFISPSRVCGKSAKIGDGGSLKMGHRAQRRKKEEPTALC